MNNPAAPHQNQPLMATGVSLDEAEAAMILIHGRGASAESILGLSTELPHPKFAYLAPQAANHTWYPQGFMSPIEVNEPGISSGMAVIESIIEHVVEAGIPHERIMIGGFSQGACLASEFVARHAQRYGGVFAFSGGLIGPDGILRDYEGSLDGTPVFFGCSDVDFHIPEQRVHHSAGILEKLGGDVTTRIYPNMDHTVNQDEIAFVREMMAGVV
jgi:predicted esterase